MLISKYLCENLYIHDSPALSPDSLEYLGVESYEGDHGDEAGADQARVVYVVPELRLRSQTIYKLYFILNFESKIDVY